MPIPEKPVAGMIAVLCFFIVGFIGWFHHLSPEICCSRALIGTMVSYGAGRVIIKTINTILTRAVIDHWIKKEQELVVDNENG